MDSAVRRYAEVGSRKMPARIGKRESSSSHTVPGRECTVPTHRGVLPWPRETHGVGKEPDRRRPWSTRHCLGRGDANRSERRSSLGKTNGLGHSAAPVR